MCVCKFIHHYFYIIMVHYISPSPLTFEVIDNILKKNYTLALSEESKKLINDCKAYLDHKIETSAKPLYGITTGFGSLCKISISTEDLSQLQANLVMSILSMATVISVSRSG